MTNEDVKTILNAELEKKIVELKNAVAPDNDLKKFMYDKNYEELNLSRDWAIKVSAFSSAVYIGVITLVSSETGKEILEGTNKILVLIILSIFTFLGVWNICLRHLSYLEYRNIQIKLQNDLGVHTWKVDNEPIVPTRWQKKIDFDRGFSRQNGLLKNKSGYLFYVFYLITTFVVTIIIIQNIPQKTTSEINYLKIIKNQDSIIRSQDSIIKGSVIHFLQSNGKFSIKLDTLNVKNLSSTKNRQ